MDIIVTIPKGQYKNIDQEISWAKSLSDKEKETSSKFWSMSRLPKNITPGDRCYFVREDKIEHYREVKDIIAEDMGFSCEVTDNYWEGPFLELSVLPVNLEKPVAMKGFQGFRYTDRIQ